MVVVSISPWGQTGPYVDKGYRTSDMVASAMGGHMHLNGDPERGPVRTTVPQAFAQANFQGSVGAMIALYARGAVLDGAGQHVDVSMQEAMANAMDHAQQTWDIRHANITGPGLYRNRGGIVLGRYLYEASDGWVACLANGGLATPRGGAIIDWLAEHGAAGELTKDEWREKLPTQQPLTDDERTHIEEVLVAFCKKHTREWLVQEAQSRGAGWAPVFSPREIVESNQLAARDYWVSVHHEDLGESFVYPGAPWKLSATPWLQRGRAPSAGEHNEEVYGELLGLDDAELRRLKMRMVV
ncbi:MAG: CoA transferase [Dehalococcoidia bacterium]|nr:CoA transferase [Dehalococcoidia bacterium]